MPLDIAAYGGLFFIAFLAATIFPAQSEAVLLGLIATQNYPAWILILVASLGNILGSVLNWYLGTYIEHFRNKKWFPVKDQSLNKAQRWYSTYGRWSLLLSWVPFIGDPITVAAGVMKERLPVFVCIVGVAKSSRYIVLYYLSGL